MVRAGRAVMFVDGDCGFCMRTAAQIHRLGVDVQARVLQDQDLAGAGIDEARALREIAVIDAHGAIHYGYLGWAAILATGPWPWRALGVVMGRGPGAAVARAAYRWVSENRTRLPGGTPACALPAADAPGASRAPQRTRC